jgi:acyl carrier protein
MSNQVHDIVAQVFGVDPADVNDDTSPDTISAWDSLGHFQLITALEAEFSVKFNMREIQTMDSVSKINGVLKARRDQA